jgi:hypothetical protein
MPVIVAHSSLGSQLTATQQSVWYPGLTELRELNLSNRSQLNSLSLKDLTKIEQLDLSKCFHLNILCLAELIELRDLNLSGCGSLNTLNLTGLGRLSYLDLSDCFSLQELKTLGNLRGMHELILNEMHNKLTLPKNIRSRVKIKRIE